jgi:excisionase family DNA binding protein
MSIAPQDKDVDRLLPIGEVAERLSISVRGVYRLIAEGLFPEPVKVGRSSRVFVSDLNAYLDGLKRGRNR